MLGLKFYISGGIIIGQI